MRSRVEVAAKDKRKVSFEEALYIQRSCLKKKQYPNKKSAESKARHAREKTGDHNIEHYRCRLGDKHYHIGHKRRKQL